MPREFCQSPDCDGLIDFGSDMDGEIGACGRCGRRYELMTFFEVKPLDDDGGLILKLVDDEEKEDRRV